VPLLEIAMRRQVVAVDIHTHLREALEEISRMVSGLINGSDKRSAEASARSPTN
jgi:hypothetical protein